MIIADFLQIRGKNAGFFYFAEIGEIKGLISLLCKCILTYVKRGKTPERK